MSITEFTCRTLVRLGDGHLQAVVWGSGRSLAYVQKSNVYYVKDVTHADRVVPLTTAGIPGEVYFGITDWIYEGKLIYNNCLMLREVCTAELKQKRNWLLNKAIYDCHGSFLLSRLRII